MAYTSGGLIQSLDYNLLAWAGNTSGTYTSTPNNVAYVWGVGNGDTGYGQTVSQINAVTAGDDVTATQWAGLVSTVNKALAHQSGTGAQLATGSNIGITSGATIEAFANVVTAVTTINTNKDSFNSTRGSTTTGSNLDNTWSSGTPTTHQKTHTVTFASADHARYFFNAGGRLNLDLSTASGTDTAKETAWTNLLNNGVGTLSLDGKSSSRSGTGYTVTTNGLAIGFWDLTGTNQTILRLTDTVAAYTANYVDIKAKVTGDAGSNGGLGTVITFTVDYNDGAADSSYNVGGTANDTISMTMRNRIDIVNPEETYLANSWGTPVVADV